MSGGAAAGQGASSQEWPALVEAYLQSSLASGHSAASVGYRRVYLQQLTSWLVAHGMSEAASVTPDALQNYIGYVATRKTSYMRSQPTLLSRATVQSEVSAVRTFFTWVAGCRIVPLNPAQDLRVPAGQEPLARRVLTLEEADRLMSAPVPEGVGLRDRAILETLYSTGLRRAELCGLDCYDVDASRGEVFVRQAKGGHERMVPIGRRALEAIQVYAGSYRRTLSADRRVPALFLSSASGRRLSVKTISLIVPQYGQKAGISWHVMPITLRHTCATHLLQGGADIREVQAILGHLCLSSTQIYTRVTFEDLRAAHDKHHPSNRRGRPLKERCSRAYSTEGTLLSH